MSNIENNEFLIKDHELGKAIVWNEGNINSAREKINICCSYLMGASSQISNINNLAELEMYANMCISIADSINETATSLLSVKSSLVRDIEKLSKADKKSEQVINALFDKYFNRGIALNNISFFNQLDYGEITYSSSNLKRSGCGITCLAGLFTDMFGYVITPSDLADEYEGDKKNGGTTDKQMIQYAAEHGISLTKYGYKDGWENGKIMKALEEGRQVILCVRNCAFTTGGHYIRLVGLTEEGKIIVHDPNGANWTKHNLKDGFVNGFDPSFMKQQGGGAFIVNEPDEEEFIKNKAVKKEDDSDTVMPEQVKTKLELNEY